MSDHEDYICYHCDRSVEYNYMPIQCDMCQRWLHGKCEKLKRTEWSVLGNSNLNWYCSKCKIDIFPFSKLDSDEFYECLNGVSSELNDLYKKCVNLEKQVNERIQERNILDSCYVTRDQLSAIAKNIMSSFSLIHFNSRSVKTNFDSIDNLLHSCKSDFSVVALSETWMNDNNGDSFESYKLPEYTVYNVNRKHKKGGGTALYIKSDIDHTFIEELSYTIENCFEVVTVQINVKHGQNMVIACLYRPPNVSIKTFLEQFTVYLNKIKSKKVFICGDFNIDLLKTVDDHDTGNFLETMFSYNLYPLIDKPTRIQETSCTAIDNIFTNILPSEIKSKILIDDTTDHLPVLCLYNNEEIKHINCTDTVKKKKDH